MKTAWEHTRLAAQRMCNDAEDSIRLTNLSIVSALAFDKELVSIRQKKAWSSSTLRRTLDDLAVSPLPELAKSERGWMALAKSASEAASLLEAAGGPDQWVVAFQAAAAGQKIRGAYATPSTFADALVRHTVRPFLQSKSPPRIIDPSAGTGALLLAALKHLGSSKSNSELRTLVYRLHGAEIDATSRELCCLLLWLNASRAGPDLQRIKNNIVLDNAVTRNWWSAQRSLFDVLVMNPPWESLRHSVSNSDPAAKARLATLKRLSIERCTTPDLPPLFSAQGRGIAICSKSSWNWLHICSIRGDELELSFRLRLHPT